MTQTSSKSAGPVPHRELWMIITLAGIKFTHLLDFMIMLPLGPQFTELFEITDAQFGLLVSSYTIAAGISVLFASTYIDKVGRRSLLLGLYACFAIATLSCALADTYYQLIAARLAAGAFGGTLSAITQTIVSETIPFERRGRASGILMMSLSVSTVAGVPIGLFSAAYFNWQAPFIGVFGVSIAFMISAAASIPALTSHLGVGNRIPLLRSYREVLSDSNHQRAFLVSALLLFGSFTVMPYITIYMQTTVGLTAAQIPYIYLCSGAVTMVTTKLFGNVTDRFGKIETFGFLSIGIIAPMLVVTLLPPATPLWAALLTTTVLFVFNSGRMVPAMAIFTSSANSTHRGMFMTLNSAIQSISMGAAAYLGGQLISRDQDGLVQGYWGAAVVAIVASIAAYLISRGIRLQGVQPSPKPAESGEPKALEVAQTSR